MKEVPVARCSVTDCCYNHNFECHAKAIQVGDEHTPACDTYTKGRPQCGTDDEEADVGACKVSECEYNQNRLCQAPQIVVGWKDSMAECLTYEHKS